MVYIGYKCMKYAKKEEVIDDVKQHIKDLTSFMVFEGLDFTVTGYEVVGSRTNGTSRPDSDLDVLIRYTGSAREDSMHSCFNDPENALHITDVLVDFIPIKEED